MRTFFVLTMVLAVILVASAHADGLGAGQPIMDMVVSILKQLMVVVVEFIRLVLGEIVNAIRSLLPDFGLGK